MKKHTLLFLLTVTLLLLYSCKEDKNISTYLVSYKDFENSVKVDGIVEPVLSTNILADGYGIIAQLIEDGVFVNEGDTICIIENEELQNRYEQQKTALDNAQANLKKTQANLKMQYALSEAEVKSNEAATQIAQLDSAQLQYYSPKQRKIRELELKKVSIQKSRFEKRLSTLSIIQSTELRKIEIEIQRLTNEAKSIKSILDNLILIAPKPGLAIRSKNPMTNRKFQVGDNCFRNFPILSIPSMDKMKVLIQASETDYRYINVGDSIFYTFDALPNEYAWGKIVHKTPIGKEFQPGSKIKFFDIEASIDSSSIVPEPGFSANCTIVLKEIKDTLVVPQIAINDYDSIKVVYVDQPHGYEMREVHIGQSSSKEVVIAKGLRSNERITLRKPSESSIKKKTLLTTDSISRAKNETIK